MKVASARRVAALHIAGGNYRPLSQKWLAPVLSQLDPVEGRKVLDGVMSEFGLNGDAPIENWPFEVQDLESVEGETLFASSGVGPYIEEAYGSATIGYKVVGYFDIDLKRVYSDFRGRTKQLLADLFKAPPPKWLGIAMAEETRNDMDGFVDGAGLLGDADVTAEGDWYHSGGPLLLDLDTSTEEAEIRFTKWQTQGTHWRMHLTGGFGIAIEELEWENSGGY